MIIGYARVSSTEQNLERQIRQLKEFGCEKIFSDKISGKDFKRPDYQKMKSLLRFGDTLVIQSLSRLGRTKQGILDEWKGLMDKEIDIVVLDMPILDTRKYKDLEGIGQLITDIVLQLLSWMVEEERENIRENQRQGIEIAKKEGKYKGKSLQYHTNAKGKNKVLYDKVIELLNQKKSVKVIHEKTGVARNTIYRIKRDQKKEIENAEKTAKIRMWLRVENNNKFVRGKKKVIESIEQSLKYDYKMKVISGEYVFYVPYENIDALKNKVDDIIQDMALEADLRNCFIEFDAYCEELGLSW